MNKSKKVIYNIMTTYNGHAPKFVMAINAIFNDDKYKESRNQILFAIAQRDKEEIKDKLGIVINDYDDVDEYDADILMHVCDDTDLEIIINFCAPFYYDKRKELFDELRNLVHKYGKMEFDGDFSFCGIDVCYFNRLADFLKLSLDSEDNIVVTERINNRVIYQNQYDMTIPNFELERMIDYIERTRKKTYHIDIVARKQIDVTASNVKEALEIAKAEMKKNPFTDVDCAYSSI